MERRPAGAGSRTARVAEGDGGDVVTTFRDFVLALLAGGAVILAWVVLRTALGVGP